MLVLTRKPKEVIKIGNDIELTVLSIDGDQVKLGISAPKDIEIHRKEIFVSIQKENSDASITNMNAFEKLKSLKKI